ncbi:hypothetical protein [Kordia sp.]|uniref:hypothetical protein n=1 Tax=Kordia sp. TaxID=1965332 RepID=UPI0025C36AE7|nr:hypothetical protein [Kordia sp.]MCH2194131.1 DUF1735 domain-containing protein [Kordia sp.]
MKKIAIFFMGALFLLTSCEETESPIYDGSQTLAYFNGTSSTLEVEINDSNTIDIEVGASTISSSDRTVSISVDTDNTTADAAIYSFPSTVTIPAGEYFTNLTVTAVDNGLTTTPETLSLKIDSIDGGGVGSSITHTVSIVEICPIASTFAVGDYTLNFVSGGIGAAGFAPALGTGITVTLAPGTASTERIFNVKCYPSFGFANAPADFSFSLVCGTTVANGIVDGQISGVGCGGSIAFGPAPTPGTYTVGDDTNMTLIFAEDTAEICGSVATTSYTLTKL